MSEKLSVDRGFDLDHIRSEVADELATEMAGFIALPGLIFARESIAGSDRVAGRTGADITGIVLISHDRRLLERISRTTLWLDRGITPSIGCVNFDRC